MDIFNLQLVFSEGGEVVPKVSIYLETHFPGFSKTVQFGAFALKRGIKLGSCGAMSMAVVTFLTTPESGSSVARERGGTHRKAGKAPGATS